MLLNHHHHHHLPPWKQQQQHELETLIPQYRFNIEAIFDHDTARDCFRKFLKDNLNEEPFMFYEMVERYQKTRLDKNRFDLAIEIMNSFIVVSAKHELNLSMTIRNDILKNWKAIQEFNENKSNDLIECPNDLFQKAQNVIFTELKQDNFPKFINSEQFKTYLKKECKKSQYNNSNNSSSGKDSSSSPITNLLEQLGTKKTTTLDRSDSTVSQQQQEPISAESSSSSPEDMTVDVVDNKSSSIGEFDRPLVDLHSTHHVSTKDYDIVKELISSLNDSTRWKVHDEKTGLKTLTSVNNYYVNPSEGSLPVICFTGLASGNHRELFNIIFSDTFTKEMDRIQKRKLQLDYLKIDPQNNIDYPNSILYVEVDTPFPFGKRDMVLAKTIIPDLYNSETDEFDRYVYIQKPTTHQDAPLSKDFIRVSLFSSIVVEKKSNDSVRYYLFDFMDLKGNVPKKLLTGLSRLAAKQFHKFLQKKFIHKDNGLKSPTSGSSENELHSSEGLVELLNDHHNYLRKFNVPLLPTTKHTQE